MKINVCMKLNCYCEFIFFNLFILLYFYHVIVYCSIFRGSKIIDGPGPWTASIVFSKSDINNIAKRHRPLEY